MEIPEYVKQFVITVRTIARQDTQYASPTIRTLEGKPGQIPTLAFLVGRQLKNQDNRIPVLQAITGLPIHSSKNLTRWTVSTLIDEVIHVSETNPTTLSDIEKLLESRTSGEPW